MSKPEPDYHQPLNKKQKRGDEAAPEPIAFGGPMYDEATARKMLQEVRFDDDDDDGDHDDEAPRGFNPDDAALDNVYHVNGWARGITPMIYFATKGDPKMCRYLISRGVSTTKANDDNHNFPLFAAAMKGHLDVCKVLYGNGAQNDVRRKTISFQKRYNLTPFIVASTHGHDQVVRWLVLHGALCANNNSEYVEVGRVHGEVRRAMEDEGLRSCESLVAWAEEVTQSHSAVVTFLGGTLPPAPNNDQSCTLQCFSGHPGVRKHIADFVGLEVTKGKHLRILQNVRMVLPFFIKD